MKEIENLGMRVETEKGSFLARRENKLNTIWEKWFERGDGKGHGKEDEHTDAICRNF